MASEIYRSELAFLKFGHALWEPDPGGLYPCVRIGDVGYCTNGFFVRLFNVLTPTLDTSLVPEGFTPLEFSGPLSYKLGPHCPGAYHSDSVQEFSASFSAGVGQGQVEFSFSRKRERGAVLVLRETAQREDARCKDLFKDYMQKHYRSWFEFATKEGHGIELSDLVLVTGRDLTAEWAMAAFNHSDIQGSGTFGTELPGMAMVKFSVRGGSTRSGFVYQHYNSQPNGEMNQCLFIRGYRVKERRFLAPKVIRAAAGPEDFGRDRPGDRGERVLSGSDGSDDDIESLSDLPKDVNLLLPLLDYVLENSNVEVAIAHDEDIWPYLPKTSFDAGDLRQRLDIEHPNIVVEDMVGMVPAGNVPDSVYPSDTVDGGKVDRGKPAVNVGAGEDGGPRVSQASPDDTNRLRSFSTPDQEGPVTKVEGPDVMHESHIDTLRDKPPETNSDKKSGPIRRSDKLKAALPAPLSSETKEGDSKKTPATQPDSDPLQVKDGKRAPIVDTKFKDPQRIERPRPSIALHPLLARGGTLEWDIKYNPTTAAIGAQRGTNRMLTSIPPLLLLSSATNPPLPSMTIVSSQIPWQIMVTPSSTSYITLSDVMSAIYTSLRTSISRAEFESLPVKAKIQVNDAFVQRWKSVAGGQREMGTERSKGVKRVDWFCGRTRFEALELAESGGGEFWVLRVRGGSQDLGDPMKHRSAPEPVEPMSLPDIYSPSHVPHTPSSRSFTRTPAAWQIHPERYAPSGSRSANQLGNTHHLQTSQ